MSINFLLIQTLCQPYTLDLLTWVTLRWSSNCISSLPINFARCLFCGMNSLVTFSSILLYATIDSFLFTVKSLCEHTSSTSGNRFSNVHFTSCRQERHGILWPQIHSHQLSPHTYSLIRCIQFRVWTPSIFAEAVLDNEFVQVIPSGQFEQVFTGAFPQGQINFSRVE